MSKVPGQVKPEGMTFKLKIGTYSLSHSYGHWTLRKVINGKPHSKPEITNKSTEPIFNYLAGAERCTPMDARLAYEHAKKTL